MLWLCPCCRGKEQAELAQNTYGGTTFRVVGINSAIKDLKDEECQMQIVVNPGLLVRVCVCVFSAACALTDDTYIFYVWYAFTCCRWFGPKVAWFCGACLACFCPSVAWETNA